MLSHHIISETDKRLHILPFCKHTCILLVCYYHLSRAEQMVFSLNPPVETLFAFTRFWLYFHSCQHPPLIYVGKLHHQSSCCAVGALLTLFSETIYSSDCYFLTLVVFGVQMRRENSHLTRQHLKCVWTAVEESITSTSTFILDYIIPTAMVLWKM